MAQDTLLNYILNLDVRTPIPDADTSFLRQVVAVVKPKGSTATGQITRVISATAAEALTDNEDVAELFAGGMAAVNVLPMANLTTLGVALAGASQKFYTVLISSDFSKAEIDAMALGTFDGVVGAAFEDQEDAKAFAAQAKHAAFKTARNMFYAFGQLLSAAEWNNLQYVQMPYTDNVSDLATADSLFADRISFVLESDQYGHRLAFFGAGGQAIIAPYITAELVINLQGAALRYLNANRPQYTVVQAKLLEDFLNTDAATRYVEPKLLDYVRVVVTLAKRNYEGSVNVTIPEPTALWRLNGILTQEAQ